MALTPPQKAYSPWGPVLVGLGASLWGTETLWRVRLNTVMPPDVMVLLEHALFLLFALPVVWQYRALLPAVPGRVWWYLLASGVLGSALGAYFFTEALGHMNASVANALLHLQPVLSTGFAILLLKERPNPRMWPWAILALLAGVLLPLTPLSDWQTGLHLDQLTMLQNALTPAVVYVLLTAGCWGFSTVAGRAINQQLPVWPASALRVIIGFMTMLVVVALKQQPVNLGVLAQPGIAQDLTILALFAGLLPLVLYFKGLQLTSAAVASFWETAQVVAALLVTWGMLGQPLMPHQVVATLVLVVAVWQIDRAQLGYPPTPADGTLKH
jgi:drug/metabolite transporter (DMT)-like permease